MSQEYQGTEIKLGNNESIRIMDEMFTVKVARELRSEIKGVVDKYNDDLEAIQAKVDEITKKYENDLKPLVINEVKETTEAFNKRIEPILAKLKEEIDAITPEDKESYVMTLAYGCLKVLADKFGQGGKLTPQSFEAASWTKVKLALAKFLISNEIPQGKLFLPPQNLD